MGNARAYILVSRCVADHLNLHSLIDLVVAPSAHLQRPSFLDRGLSFDVGCCRIEVVPACEGNDADEVVVVAFADV